VAPSKRALDFNNIQKMTQLENVNIAQKLNEVVFPKYVGNSPFIPR
jgi:hypothetical protein